MQLPVHNNLLGKLKNSGFDFEVFNSADTGSIRTETETFVHIESNTNFSVIYYTSGTTKVDKGGYITVPKNCPWCCGGWVNGKRCGCANGVKYVKERVSNYVNEPWSKTHVERYNFKNYFMAITNEYSDYHLKKQKRVFKACSKTIDKLVKEGVLNYENKNQIEERCDNDFESFYKLNKNTRITEFLAKGDYRPAHLDEYHLNSKSQKIKACVIFQVKKTVGDKSITVCRSDGKFFITDSNNLSFTSTAYRIRIVFILVFLLSCLFAYFTWGQITADDFSFYGPLEVDWLKGITDTIVDSLPKFLADLVWASIVTISSTLLLGITITPIVKKFSINRADEIESAEIFAESLAANFD